MNPALVVLYWHSGEDIVMAEHHFILKMTLTVIEKNAQRNYNLHLCTYTVI